MKPMHEALAALDLGRFCHFCDEQITGTPVEVLGVFDRVEGFAHDGCLSAAAEAAWDRSVARREEDRGPFDSLRRGGAPVHDERAHRAGHRLRRL